MDDRQLPYPLVPAPAEDSSAGIGADIDDAAVEREQIDLLYTNLPGALVATTITSAMVAGIHWPVIAPAVLIAWWTALAAVSLARLALWRGYRREDPSSFDIPRWQRRFDVGAGLSGTVWGSAGLLLYAPDSPLYQAFLLLGLGGMITGAVSVYPSNRRTFLLFALPTGLPITVRLFAQGDAAHLVMGGVAIMFHAVLLGISRNIHASILESLALRVENRALVRRLSSEKSDLDALNASLVNEIEERRRAEQDLAENERRLHTIIEGTFDAIAIHENGLVLEANDALGRMLGYPLDHIVGRSILDFVAPESREEATRHFREGLEFPREVLGLHRDGSRLYCEVIGRQYRYRGRDVRLTAVRDITARRVAEEALRASENQYRLLVDHANDIIYRTDAQGYLIFVNVVTPRLTGYPEQELLGRRFVDFIRPDHRPAAERFYGRQFIRKTTSTYYEYPLVRKDGAEIWIGQNVQVLLNRDKVVGFQAVARDITERKRIEDALRASQEQYKMLVEASTDIIYSADPSGHFTFVSPAAMRITQYTEPELLGRRFVELIREDHKKPAERFYGRQFVRKIPSTYYEFPIVCKDGSERWVGQRVQTLVEDGRVIGFHAVVRDITDRKQAEEKQRQLLNILEAATDLVGTVTPDGQAIYLNRAGRRMLGLEETGPLAGVHAADFHPDWAADIVLREGFPTAALKGSWEGETAILARDGREIPVSQVIVAHKTALGDVAYFSEIIRDISEYKRSEDALRESQAFLTSVLENIPNMIFVKDATDLRFVRFNKAGEELLGLPRQELIGKNDYDFFPKDEADFFTAKDRDVLAGGALLDVPEEPIRTKDKGLRYLHTKKLPLLDELGRPRYLLGISEDITERKAAEDAARRHARLTHLSADVHAALVQSAAIPEMLQRCTEALLRHLDAAFARIWLLGPGDLCAACHKAAHCAAHDRCLHLAASAGLSTNLDGEYRRVPLGALKIGRIAQGWGPIHSNDVLGDDRLPNKTWMREHGLVSFAGQPLKLGDEMIGVAAFFARRPLTEHELAAFEATAKTISLGITRKRSEEALRRLNEALTTRSRQLEEANRELESFSYSVSHDLRAPLRHIGGFGDLLKARAGEALDDKSARYLQVMLDSSKQMGDLIDSLLNFSRVGRQPLATTPVDLGRLVAAIVESFQQNLAGRTVDWTIGALPVVPGDPALLRTVLMNLVGNAVKYTGTRERAVIEVGAYPEAGEWVIFVKDNGVGFDMQYAHKLFGVFQRLHTDAEFEGIGIGLANVRRIVARHGGRVWAEGAEGGGATFFFSLPREKA